MTNPEDVYGKDDVDEKNILTLDQWHKFLRWFKLTYTYTDGELDWGSIYSAFDKYVEESK